MFTLFRALDSEAAYHIYPSCLSGRGYGYPLWRPEPHDTGEPQIGDVGYVREGAFVRLFNINISAAAYQVEGWHPQFKIEEPPSLGVFRVAQYTASLMAGSLKSRGVEEVEISGKLTGGPGSGASAGLSGGYSCREVHGALLVLKSHADAESLYDNRELEDYIIREHHKWHAYAIDDVGHRVKPEDIVLVSGWIKAPADWATAAFSNTSSTESLSVTSQIGQFFGFGLSGKHHKAYSGPRMERRGVMYPKVADRNAPRDQCLFVKRYKIKRRARVVRVLQAGAGYDSPPSGRGDDGSQSSPVRSANSDTEDLRKLFGEWEDAALEPLDILLDYILEISGAEYALARDEDVEGMLGGDAPTDFSTYLRRKQPAVLVEDNCGRISNVDLLLRTQAKLERPRITSLDLVRWPAITVEGRAGVRSARVQLPRLDKGKNRGLQRYAFLEFKEPGALTVKAPYSYALSSDGALVAAACSRPDITIWRTCDGLRLHTLSNVHADGITAIAFSTDRRRIASGSRDETIAIWDVIYGVALLRFPSRGPFPSHLAFSPDGHVLLSGANDGAAIFWDPSSGDALATFALGTAVRGILFHKLGAHAAIAVTNRVLLFAMEPQITQRAAIASTATPAVLTVDFSPSGERVLVCALGQFARIYSTANGREVLRLDQRGRYAVAAAFAPDGATVASIVAGKDRQRDARFVVQDALRGTELLAVDDYSGTRILAISPDGALIVHPDGSGDLMVRNARSGERIATMEGMAEGVVTQIKFLSDSRRILFAGSTGPIGVTNVADILRVRLQ
ncbi:WD40 repeat domain-containing protein [Phanerochaete sordida]|uniref:WD40 repeat domain-containing protein n=1 Tax=Phanerochaete sordida TaxID=48140 RepID=A0A9P3GIK2_9APHY|nr:WD40 repeat domain-containing protein [Phanerochaete sordida]